jgi:hypothetical protein
MLPTSVKATLRSAHHLTEATTLLPGQFFRPLDPILFSATMVRRRSVALPSLPAATITSPRPHGPTIIEPRVAIVRSLC